MRSLNSYKSPEEIPREILIQSLKSYRVLESLLDWASTQPDREIALAMLMNPKTSQQQLETLFKTFDTHFGLDNPRIYHPYFNEDYEEYENALDVLDNISNHLNWEAKEKAYNWQEKVFYEIIFKEYTDKHGYGIAVLGEIINLDFDYLINAKTNNERYKCFCRTLLQEVTKTISCAKELKELQAITTNNTKKIEEFLSEEDRYCRIKCAILKNPNLNRDTTEKVLDLMIDNSNCIHRLENGKIENILDKYPKITKSFLEKIAEKTKLEDNMWCRFLAKNHHTPIDILTRLADSSNLNVLIALSTNPNISQDTSLKLVALKKHRINEALIDNPSIPRDITRQCSRTDSWSEVDPYDDTTSVYDLRQIVLLDNVYGLTSDACYRLNLVVANHPNANSEILTMLSKSPYADIRSNVARNYKTPLNILEQLAQDEDREVRYSVLHNPKLTKKDFYKWMRDIYGRSNYSLGCLLALLDPNISPKILEENADSLLWNERFIIAIHPKTPKETIQRLSNDGNFYVRAAALECL